MADDHQFTRVEIERIGDRVVPIGGPNEGIVLLAGFGGGANAQNRRKGDGKESATAEEDFFPTSDCHGEPHPALHTRRLSRSLANDAGQPLSCAIIHK